MAEAGLVALVLHDWARTRNAMRAAFAIGDDPSLALEMEQRLALNAAHQGLRTRTALWFAGAGTAPWTDGDTLADPARAV